MVDPRYAPGGNQSPLRAADLAVAREVKERAQEIDAPDYPGRATMLLSEIENDSATMTGATAADVFDAGSAATPETIADSVADVGSGVSGFARTNHRHAHGDRGGGTLHAVAGASAGFMSAADKTALDALVAAGDGVTLGQVVAQIAGAACY